MERFNIDQIDWTNDWTDDMQRAYRERVDNYVTRFDRDPVNTEQSDLILSSVRGTLPPPLARHTRTLRSRFWA
jgi:hypothetical protein